MLYTVPLIFNDLPEDFIPKIEVAACFLKVGDEFLFLHRTANVSEPNKWGIPGGKVQKGESAEEAVIREIQEETGFQMEAAHLNFLGKVYIRQFLPAIDFTYSMFEYQIEEKFEVSLNFQEHRGFTWMSLRDSLNYPLIQGEHECIEIAYGNQNSSVEA